MSGGRGWCCVPAGVAGWLSECCGDEVGGVAVEASGGALVSAGGAWVGVSHGVLEVVEVGAAFGGDGGEGVA